MQKIIFKALQGLVVSFIFVFIVTFNRWEVMLYSKIWIVFFIAVIASVFQPSYSPFQKDAKNQDNFSALWIVWTVYLSQTVAILESIYWHYPHSMSWSILDLFFVGISFVGLFLRSWAYLKLGVSFTWHIDATKNQPVISDGPYTFVAHPSYTGAFLTYSFYMLVLNSYYSFCVFSILLFVVFYRRIHFEEKFLVKKLGEPYLVFLKTRKKIFPFVF